MSRLPDEVKGILVAIMLFVVLYGSWRFLYVKPHLRMIFLNQDSATELLLCQVDKVYRDRGVHEGKKYLTGEVAVRAIKESETMQEILWKDGYMCNTPLHEVPWQGAYKFHKVAE